MICIRAACPTTALSAERNHTTDGSVNTFSRTGTRRSFPCRSKKHAAVLVVPKSIPRTNEGFVPATLTSPPRVVVRLLLRRVRVRLRGRLLRRLLPEDAHRRQRAGRREEGEDIRGGVVESHHEAGREQHHRPHAQ